MKSALTLILAIGFAFVLSVSSVAQLTLNDAGASLTVNGLVPHADAMHDVLVPSGPQALLELNVSSGSTAYAGVTLFASLSDVGGPLAALPWGDSLDIGQYDPVSGSVSDVYVLVDGIGLTTNLAFDLLARTNGAGDYLFVGTSSPALAGSQIAVQFVVQDPTAAPLFLDMTEAASLNFTTFTTTTYLALGDDDYVTHALSVPIVFGGQTYTTIDICSNGAVSFGGAVTDYPFTNGSTVTPMSMLFGGLQAGLPAGAPGVAVSWTDLNYNSTGVFEVHEYSQANVVEVVFSNQVYYSTDMWAGESRAWFGTAGPGSVVLDLHGWLQDGTPTLMVVGCTDGDPSVGADVDLTDPNVTNTGFQNAITTGGGSYVSPGAFTSVGEVMDASLPIPHETISFVDQGTFDWIVY